MTRGGGKCSGGGPNLRSDGTAHGTGSFPYLLLCPAALPSSSPSVLPAFLPVSFPFHRASLFLFLRSGILFPTQPKTCHFCRVLFFASGTTIVVDSAPILYLGSHRSGSSPTVEPLSVSAQDVIFFLLLVPDVHRNRSRKRRLVGAQCMQPRSRAPLGRTPPFAQYPTSAEAPGHTPW